jgi:hypothetical protein
LSADASRQTAAVKQPTKLPGDRQDKRAVQKKFVANAPIPLSRGELNKGLTYKYFENSGGINICAV